LDMLYFKDLLPQLASAHRGYTLFFEVKPNLSRDRMRTMRQAGVEWIQPGLESLHDAPLALMRKGTSAAINLQVLKWAREEGICTIWSILTGVPGEDPHCFVEMAEMIERLVHLQPPMGWNAIAYHRFSPYHSTPEAFGLKLVASWMHYFVYPLDTMAMQGIGYHFQDVKHLDLAQSERPPIPGIEMAVETSEEALQLLHAINRWRSLFWSRVPPIMALTDYGDHSTILDTRPCAKAERLTLEGLSHQLYRLCDAARSREGIARELERLNGCASDPCEVDTILHDLIDRNLMLEVTGRFFALATAGDVPRLPRGREYPGGFVARQHDEQILMARESAEVALH
jgi:magnesium-protoporphyrin IX monomethyl ester (oxidative) cyclase